MIQRFGSALNLTVHFHIRFLDGVYVARPDGSLQFGWAKAPTSAELAGLAQSVARRIGRFLERQGLLERDAENSYPADDALEDGPMEQLPGSSNTYCIAAGPHQERKVFTLQTLADSTEPLRDGVGKVGGFSFARDRCRDSALLANKKAVWPERAGFESHHGAHQCRSPLDRSL